MQAYTGLLKEYVFQISTACGENPYDNAQAESFFKTPKSEKAFLMKYRSMEEVKEWLAEFIDLSFPHS